MFGSLFEFWYELPVWLRITFSLALIGVSTVILLAADRIWFWGWAVGGVLLVFSFAGSGGGKGGYNF